MATVYLKDRYSMADLPSVWSGGVGISEHLNDVGPDYLERYSGIDAIGLKGNFAYDGSTYDGTITEVVVAFGSYAFPNLRIVTNFNMQNGEYANVVSGNLFVFVSQMLAGNDTIYGGLGNQRLSGFVGNDVLIGGPGEDELRGGTGNNTASYATARARVVADLVTASNNDGDADGDTYNDIDNLIGSRFSDFLSGDGDPNRVLGGIGNDGLEGRGGNDALTGGAGLDKLWGGLGADDFIYINVADSRGSARDLIRDFSRAEGDDIWLRAIDANTKAGGNQNFTFIGTKAFSGKPGELRYQRISSDTQILGDTNGDKVADIIINSDLVVNFIQSDFVL